MFLIFVFLIQGPPRGDSGQVFQAGQCGFFPSIGEVFRFMQILVRDNNVDQALRALKKKLQREGVFREMKLRRHFEKPSEKRCLLYTSPSPRD